MKKTLLHDTEVKTPHNPCQFDVGGKNPQFCNWCDPKEKRFLHQGPSCLEQLDETYGIADCDGVYQPCIAGEVLMGLLWKLRP